MKKNLINVFIFTALLWAPFFTLASVKINEIAWMGTEASSYGEWLELYNDSELEFDLIGAGLYEEGGNVLIISLTKKIGPKSYYLIERVTPSNPDPIPEIADDMGSFGGSGLKNGGEYLVLKLTDGTVLDSVDAIAGWSAGESDTKNGVRTMQLSGGSWITATATPKAINTSISSDSDTTADAEDVTTDTLLENNQTITYSSHSSPIAISQPIEKIKVSLSAGRNRISLSGTPIIFMGKFTDNSGQTIQGGSFNWSFGDGSSVSSQQVEHIYDIPGEYTVILDANYGGDEYIGRSFVRVIEPNFDIRLKENILFINNKLSNEVNLKGWKVENGNKSFVFKNDTIILAGKTNPFISKILGFDTKEEDTIKLISPNNKIISSYRSSSKKEEPVGFFMQESSDVFPSAVVDDSIDNKDKDKLKLELSRLETELKKLQNSLVASVSSADKIVPVEEKPIINKNAKILEEIKKETKATTPEALIIKLEPQKKDSVVWAFFKKLIYH